jgi:hypothetical protein
MEHCKYNKYSFYFIFTEKTFLRNRYYFIFILSYFLFFFCLIHKYILSFIFYFYVTIIFFFYTESCLNYNPKDRPSTKELLSLALFDKYKRMEWEDKTSKNECENCKNILFEEGIYINLFNFLFFNFILFCFCFIMFYFTFRKVFKM